MPYGNDPTTCLRIDWIFCRKSMISSTVLRCLDLLAPGPAIVKGAGDEVLLHEDVAGGHEIVLSAQAGVQLDVSGSSGRCRAAQACRPLAGDPSCRGSRSRRTAACRRPLTQLRRAVLPAPLGPMMASISSGLTSRLTLDRALTPPKLRDTSSIRITASLPFAPWPSTPTATMNSPNESVCRAPALACLSSCPPTLGVDYTRVRVGQASAH